jgi:glycosyltransferase involved in cell wall biosynthesis
MAGLTRAVATIVVPCYNEGQRFDVEAFRAFAGSTPDVRFVFVNDGSTDDTSTILQALVASRPESFDWINHERNRGKAEAVRTGMLHEHERSRYVGYWDADLAIPLSEIPRFMATLDARPDLEICFGARVPLLGRLIRRRRFRHYGSRMFAFAASVALRLPIYDTQCGAKLFRASPDVRALFAEPFLGRWTFDVEVIARLAVQRQNDARRLPRDVIYELPLNECLDAGPSKVTPFDLLTALLELRRIRRKYLSGTPTSPDEMLAVSVAPSPAEPVTTTHSDTTRR